jgi:hypothetical protein
MRWVVELPAPSGGTAATVTVESDSWAGALSSARGGVSIRKFRCEFENEGVVRVNDLEANERYTVRPYRASLVPAGDAPGSAAAGTDATAPVLRGVTIPPAASGRPSRTPASGAGSFSVAPPPGTSVAMPPRSSTPPTPAFAADPVSDIDVPSALSGTVVTSSVPAVVAEKPAEAPAPAIVPDRPAEPPPPPVVPEQTAELTPPAVVAEKPVIEQPAEAAAPTAPTEKVAAPLDLGATVVDLPIFVAPTPTPAPEPSPAPAVIHEVVERPTSNGSHEAALVSSTLLFERDQDPSATNPLTYRERVFTVASGTSLAQAEALARHSLTTLKRSLATRPRGRYVTVAVFDHVFSHRPSESPLVVLRWKDWRSDVPELQVRPALPPVAPPAPVTAPVPNGAGAGVDVPVAEVVAAEDAAPSAPTDVAAALPIAAPDSVPADAEALATAPVIPPAAPPAADEPAAAAPSVDATVVETASSTVEGPVADAPVAVVVPPPTEVAPVVTVTEPAPTVVVADAAPAIADAAPAVAEATPTTAPEAPTAQPEAPAVAVVEAPPTAATDPLAERASTGPEITDGAPVTVIPTDDAGSGEHEAATSDPSGSPSTEQGGRRKKRRGRRESQPSLPVVEPSAQVVAAATSTAATVVASDRPRFLGGRRGPDLLSDLFDSVMELSFQHSAAEVCACVAGVLTQNLRCDAVLVFSYDINRDEFVVQGEANTGRMDQRVRAKAGAYGSAMRSKRGVNVAEAKGDDRADAGCEGGPALFVPAMFHERLFALVQLARLPGSPAFEADELDAVTYISGQLAEALAQHSMRQTATDLAEKKDASNKATVRRR